MLKIGEIQNEVILGRDDYLFLAGGAHNVADYVTGQRALSSLTRNTFTSNIRQRQSWAASIGSNYLHLIFADKQTVIPEKYPHPAPQSVALALLEGAGGLDDVVFCTADILRAGGSQALTKVDTHYSGYGSLLISAEVVKRIYDYRGPSSIGDIDQISFEPQISSGDLGSKLEPVRYEEIRKNLLGNNTVWIHNEMGGGNNGIIDIRINSKAPLRSRCLVMSDSFGRDLALFLSLWLSEVIFCRTEFFHPDLVNQIRPDTVITGNSERYIPSTRADTERPAFLMYPYQSSFAYTPPPAFARAFSAILSYPRKPYWRFMSEVSQVPAS